MLRSLGAPARGVSRRGCLWRGAEGRCEAGALAPAFALSLLGIWTTKTGGRARLCTPIMTHIRQMGRRVSGGGCGAGVGLR